MLLFKNAFIKTAEKIENGTFYPYSKQGAAVPRFPFSAPVTLNNDSKSGKAGMLQLVFLVLYTLADTYCTSGTLLTLTDTEFETFQYLFE